MPFSSISIQNIISDVVSENTLGIHDNNEYQQFTIKAVLFNPDIPEWELELRFAEAMVIFQEEETFGDTVVFEASVQPKDHIEITRNYRNLRIRLTFRFLGTKDSVYDDNKLPITKEYLVFIKDKQDILKRDSYRKFIVTEEDGKSEETVTLPEQNATLLPIDFQLIEPELYKIRNNMVNTILKDTTVENAIKYVASKLGVTRLYLYPPDNTATHRNMYIDPEHGSFEQVFDFIQDKYGVYKTGLSYNYTNGVLYVYPTNDLKAVKNKTLHIVNTESNKYVGLSKLHKFRDVNKGLCIYTTMYILNTVKPEIISLNESSSENTATTYAVYRSDRIIDVAVATTDKAEIPKDNVFVLDSKDDGMVDSGAIRLKYVKATNNMFKLASELVKYNYEFMMISLPIVVPFTQESRNPLPINIGHKCLIHYDTDEGVKTVDGVVSTIGYTISRHQTNPTFGYTFSCVATIGIKMAVSSQDYSTKIVKEKK